MRWSSCGIIAISLLVGAVGAQDDAAKKDLDSLQGIWQLVSLEVEGKPLPEDQVKGTKMTFKGNKASHPGPDGKIEEGTFTLDPSKKPKAIDISPLGGPDKGKTLRVFSIKRDTWP